MSKYKSFSLHQQIYNCRKIIAAIATASTAIALPLTILGVGTVGAAVYEASKLSASVMIPNVSYSDAAEEQEETSSAEEDVSSEAVSDDDESGKSTGNSDDEDDLDDSQRGTVKEMTIQSSGVNYGNVYVKDGNSNYDVDIEEMLNSEANCAITKNSDYQVLIVHTHTTECYADSDKDWYSLTYDPRTTDKSESVVAVADEIEAKLNAAGIKTLHVTTYHDYPEYTGAYDRARETIQSYLEKYPSIQMVIDVHRDSITQDDNTKIKPTVTINGKKAAQVMIISGCDNDGTLNFPGWEDNLIMATQLQKQLADDYEGLARPLYFAPFRYNMDLTPNSLLIEFGTDVNTLEEAVYSGQLVGEALVKVLEQYVVE